MNEHRLVQCRKYGKPLPGLATAPLPGSAGTDIYQNVSARAWQEWQELQTMLINENHLSMRDASARKWLTSQREKFFRNEDYERPAGYVPVE
ncbi:MAG: oxidative damage protection protein [Pseudomonadales bacterium]|nr:oxidative damage protection protein [Pseudomonadales bacterium]